MVWAFGESFIQQIYKNTGYDCLIIDMEHSAFSYETVQTLVQTCRLCNLFPIVRVAKAGVVVPMIESAEQAAQFVRFSKYPPLGARGMGPGLIKSLINILNRFMKIRFCSCSRKRKPGL